MSEDDAAKGGSPGVSTTKQGTETHQAERRRWVEATIWTERMLAALDNGVKGGKWFSLIDKAFRPTTLEAAWRQVAANKGAAGVDGISVERFRQNAPHYLRELGESLKDGTYRPEPVRRVYIPKADGKRRPLGIPAVKDRIVQAALKMVLEPIFEQAFLPVSFGFRPGLGCKDALRNVDELLKSGFIWVVDADMKSYFDSIPHDNLMNRVKEKISDSRVLDLLELFLKQDIMEDTKRWTPTSGTPQGAVLSPLLANIYLHPLDALITNAGHAMIRYADDFVILCRSRAEAEEALELVRTWVADNGLSLHPDKTHVGNCTGEGEGFEFLGYRFECGRRHVRKKSVKSLRERIRERTRRTCGKSIEMVIAAINPTLKGWFEYFQHAWKSVFPSMDGFVRRRLRAILRTQKKRPGFGKCLSDHLNWPNSFFAALGLFTMTEAHRRAHQSRCGNH